MQCQMSRALTRNENIFPLEARKQERNIETPCGASRPPLANRETSPAEIATQVMRLKYLARPCILGSFPSRNRPWVKARGSRRSVVDEQKRSRDDAWDDNGVNNEHQLSHVTVKHSVGSPGGPLRAGRPSAGGLSPKRVHSVASVEPRVALPPDGSRFG